MEYKLESKLNKRAIVFYFLFLSSVIMVLSGALLDSIDFEDTERFKLFPKVFHKVSVSVFFISTIFHIFFNWTSILRYIKKPEKQFAYIKELSIAGGTISILLLLSILYVFRSHI